jgi:hypothetical protein
MESPKCKICGLRHYGVCAPSSAPTVRREMPAPVPVVDLVPSYLAAADVRQADTVPNPDPDVLSMLKARAAVHPHDALLVMAYREIEQLRARLARHDAYREHRRQYMREHRARNRDQST